MLHIISPLDTQKFSASDLKGLHSNDYKFLTDIAKEKNAVFLVSDTCGSAPKFNAHWAVKYLKRVMADCNLYFIVADATDIDEAVDVEQLNEYKLCKKIKKIINKPIQFYHFYKIKDTEYFDLPNWQFLETDYCNELSTEFKYKISCLNNRYTKSRHIISSALLNLNSYITFNDKIYPQVAKMANIENSQANERKLHQIFPTNGYIKDAYSHAKNKESINLIKNSFCNVITESPFFCKWPRFSEKTLKPMQAARPFVLVSPLGSLQWLQENGFRSFSKWWDESYDEEPNHYIRIEKVYKVLEDINKLSISDCVSMLTEMQDVLVHNQQHLQTYSKNMIDNLIIK
jgi:hypothetical protein